jgi:hypothetical protein
MSALNPLRHYPLKSPLRQKMKRKEEELDSIRAITFYLCYPAGKYLPASLTQHQSHASGIRSFRKFYYVITGKSNRLLTSTSIRCREDISSEDDFWGWQQDKAINIAYFEHWDLLKLFSWIVARIILANNPLRPWYAIVESR